MTFLNAFLLNVKEEYVFFTCLRNVKRFLSKALKHSLNRFCQFLPKKGVDEVERSSGAGNPLVIILRRVMPFQLHTAFDGILGHDAQLLRSTDKMVRALRPLHELPRP